MKLYLYDPALGSIPSEASGGGKKQKQKPQEEPPPKQIWELSTE